MIKGTCPICAKPYETATLADLPTFPFCSARCRLIDLGRWIDGAYAIPTHQDPRSAEPGSDHDDEGDDPPSSRAE